MTQQNAASEQQADAEPQADAEASSGPSPSRVVDHAFFDRATSLPGPARGAGSEVWRAICTGALRLGGWRMEGDWPPEKKMVLVAAPHTSNWDGIWMLAAAGYYRIPLKWMGKKSLTEGPFGGFVKAMGCVPIDRTQNNDVVAQTAAAFAAADELVLAIPPEGTRAKTPGWKTGFYHIAREANVPIVLTVLDYGSRTIRVSGRLTPTGDYDADLNLIMTHYEGARGKRRGLFSAEAAIGK